MSDRILIAVDGGNSKTDLVVVRSDGALLAHARGPGCSPISPTHASVPMWCGEHPGPRA